MQHPVAEGVDFAAGQLGAAAEGDELGPGDQVGGGQDDFQPGGVGVEAVAGQVGQARGLGLADAVLDAGVLAVAQFQAGQLSGNDAGCGVGDERGHPHAVNVGEPQLRPRVGAFFAQYQAGPGRPGSEVDQGRGFGHPRPIAQATTGVDGRVPALGEVEGVHGVLDPGSTGVNKQFASSVGDAKGPSAFYWNVIAPAWNNQIEQADISITLPGKVNGVGCSVGAGVGQECGELAATGDTIHVTASNLAPRTPVTVRAAVDAPTPPRTELPWSYRWDRVLGRSVPRALWILGLTLATGLGSWLWWRATVETPPGFPLQYAPPKGLGPVQCDYIRTEKVPAHALTATLFYLADRGLISLNQSGPKKWTVTGKVNEDDWADVDSVSRQVGTVLKVTWPGDKFVANGTASSGGKLAKAKTDMAAEVSQWAFDEGLMVKRGKELWLPFANFVSLVLAVCGFVGWGFSSTLWGLPFAIFFLLSARVWGSGVGTRRTPAGRELWSQVGGFYRMLTTDSAEARFDFAAARMFLAFSVYQFVSVVQVPGIPSGLNNFLFAIIAGGVYLVAVMLLMRKSKEHAVAIAHGWAKVTGKPMAAALPCSSAITWTSMWRGAST